eukprot:3007298-Pleurochrysis_carterae.AAC.1
MSAVLKVLNENEAISARSSSSERGMLIPPKSAQKHHCLHVIWKERQIHLGSTGREWGRLRQATGAIPAAKNCSQKGMIQTLEMR